MYQDSLQQASKLLLNGNIIAFPTETVYGIGGDATNDDAINKIYFVKKRPIFNPLIIHIHSLIQAQEIGSFSKEALDLAHKFWPGPLTIIVKKQKNNNISPLATAGLDTIALRIPNHDIALSLLQIVDKPIAAPSANPSGYISPTNSSHVQKNLVNGVAMIIEGHAASIGIESTIVDCTSNHPKLLRPGFITIESLIKIVPNIITNVVSEKINAPGLLKSHYAPKIPIRLNAQAPKDKNEALLAFGKDIMNGYKKVLNLSPTENLAQAASNLFAFMHELDNRCFSGIAVSTIPNLGIGVAINNRLCRAAYIKSS